MAASTTPTLAGSSISTALAGALVVKDPGAGRAATHGHVVFIPKNAEGVGQPRPPAFRSKGPGTYVVRIGPRRICRVAVARSANKPLRLTLPCQRRSAAAGLGHTIHHGVTAHAVAIAAASCFREVCQGCKNKNVQGYSIAHETLPFSEPAWGATWGLRSSTLTNDPRGP